MGLPRGGLGRGGSGLSPAWLRFEFACVFLASFALRGKEIFNREAKDAKKKRII